MIAHFRVNAKTSIVIFLYRMSVRMFFLSVLERIVREIKADNKQIPYHY